MFSISVNWKLYAILCIIEIFSINLLIWGTFAA